MSNYYGYDVGSGYLGDVDGRMMEFPTEKEYNEMVEEKEKEENEND